MDSKPTPMELEIANYQHDEKVVSTAYVREDNTIKYHKSALERRLVWKSDLLILPLVALAYFSAYLDRNSIGNARLQGLQKSLNMSSKQYHDCANMFCESSFKHWGARLC